MSLRNRKDASGPSVDPPAVKQSLIESQISQLEGNLEQNYLITELKISENRSYRVIKSNLKFLDQVIYNMHREGPGKKYNVYSHL